MSSQIGQLEESNSKPITLEFLVVNLLFLSIIFPYVSPIVFPESDLQIPVFLFASFLGLLFILKTKNVKVSLFEIYFFLFALLSIFYELDSYNSVFNIKQRALVPSAFLLYFIIKRYGRFFSHKTFLLGIFLYIVAVLWQLTDPSSYSEIVSGNFIREVKTPEIFVAGRGLSSLTPEPSFLAVMAYFLLIHLPQFIGNHKKKSQFFLSCLLIIIILLTQSISGLMLLCIFFAAKFLKNPLTYLFLFVPLFFILIAQSDETWRIIEFLKSLSKGDFSQLLANFSSIVFRISGVLTGIFSIFYYPFGSGVGTHELYRMEVYYAVQDFYGYLGLNILQTAFTGTPSSFTLLSIEFGLFYWCFFLLVIAQLINNKVYKWQDILFVIFLMLQSFSFAFPVIWYMVANNKNRNLTKET